MSQHLENLDHVIDLDHAVRVAVNRWQNLKKSFTRIENNIKII